MTSELYIISLSLIVRMMPIFAVQYPFRMRKERSLTSVSIKRVFFLFNLRFRRGDFVTWA